MAGFDEALATVAAMSATELSFAWRRLRKAPPPNVALDLLCRGLAWHLQVER